MLAYELPEVFRRGFKISVGDKDIVMKNGMLISHLHPSIPLQFDTVGGSSSGKVGDP